MPAIAKLLFQNNLLAKLARSDLERVRPFLEKVDLPRNASLAEPGTISDYTYFPETGIGSKDVGPPAGANLKSRCSAEKAWRPPPESRGLRPCPIMSLCTLTVGASELQMFISRRRWPRASRFGIF